MGVVVSLIILAVGVFAFFVTVNQLANQYPVPADGNWSNMTDYAKNMQSRVNNVSATGNSVFNVIGIVLIIGAIMSIVGVVYNYIKM